MDLNTTFVLAVFYLGPPIVVGIAWWVWLRRNLAASPKWRAVAIPMGLLADGTNVLMFYTWVVYRAVAGSAPRVWEVKDMATIVAGYLVIAALVGATVGKGAARIWLTFSALMGILPWIPLGAF